MARARAHPGDSVGDSAQVRRVTLFEISSLLCLSSKWFRRAWLAVMLPFHVLSWPLLQLLFLHNILLICVLVVDLDGIADRLGMKRRLGMAPAMGGG